MKSGIKLIWATIILTALCILPMINLVSAADQTQQYNKIFLNPFYRNSLSLNTNYDYVLNVNPPDGISSVKSAIVSFNAQINGQTQNFTLLVNGQKCNNPEYYIATAFSTTGTSQIYFDCSNRINGPGTYNVTLRSAVNTGTVQGWLDLTYMNGPGKKIDIFGTEYTIGDSGKVFIQLLENQITPINNASCYITVFTPSGSVWYDKSLMTYQTGSNALYYFDFTAPVTKGVYMTDVYCEYYTSTQTNKANAYSQATGWYVSGNGTSVTEVDSNYLITVEKNTNTGALTNVTTLLMAHLDEFTGTSTLDSSASPTTGTHFNNPTIGIPGQAGSAAVSYSSGSDYTQFSAASKLNLGATEAYMVCLSFNESVTNANGNRLLDASATDTIRISFDGGNKIRFISDRAGSAATPNLDTPSTYLDSLWHTMCAYANFTTQQIYIDGSLVASQNAAQSGTMTLSNGIFLAQKDGGGNKAAVSLDEVCYIKGTQTNFNSPTPQTLATNYNTNKQCGTPTNTLDLNVSISGLTVFPNYINWNIVTTYQWNELVETMDMYVYNYTGSSWYKLPNALSYAVGSDSIVSSQLTSNISQFISGGVMTFRMNDSMPTGPTIGRLSLNQIKLVQTAYVQIPATQIRGGGEIHVSDIPSMTWAVPVRTLTAYPNITASIDTGAVAFAVWNNTDRNLTYYADVTNYTKVGESVWTSSLAIPSGLLTQIANAVWTRSDRNLTFYPTQVDMTNYTLIAQTTWNYATRNLTFYPNQTDLTDYNRIIIGVWNATTRNLTYYPAQVDLTNYSAITNNVVNGVWNATIRNLTYYPSQIDLTNYTQVADSVWNAASRNLTYTADVTNYNNIIVGVWNYTTRNLTFYPAQTDMTNYTRIDETIFAINQSLFNKITDSTNSILLSITDVNNSLTSQILLVPSLVWTFNNRNLTYYEHIDMTNYTEVANSVWNAAIRNLTFYPTQLDLTNYTLISDTVWTASDRNLTFYADPTDYNKIFIGVWNNTDRNLTFYPAQVDMTNYTLIIGETSNAVWNATTRNLTFYPQQVDLTNYTLITEGVWNAADRNLTYYQNFGDQTNYTQIIVGVWNATDRNLTFYPAQVDLTNYTAITENVVGGVWNATDRNLTFYPQQIDLTNYTQVAESVWNAGSRNLTYTNDVTDYDKIIVGVWNATDRNLTFYPAQVDLTNYTKITEDVSAGVWIYSDRNLTYYPAQVDLTNYTLIAETVWNNAIRNLTYYEHIDMTNYTEIIIGVWNATDRNLTYYPAQVDLTNYTAITENVVEGVWNATDRNLTYYPSAVDMTNYTEVANVVWNAGSRNLTYTEDVTDYNRIIIGVWNATDRNLTFYPAQVDMTNYTLISDMIANNSINYTLVADNVWEWNGVIIQNILNQIGSSTSDYVWNATDRNLTFYPAQVDMTNYTLIAETVWTDLNRTLTDFDFTVSVNETAIANAVWQSVDRTLTSFNFTVNATMDINETEISDAVWSAVNRTLTDYNQSDLTDYEKIQTMVWNATSRNLTYYENFGDQTNYTLISDMIANNSINYTLIQEMVWDATNRTLTDFNFDVNVNTTAIAEAVWASVNRTLTDYNQSDLTNYTLIQEVVWTAANRTLTDFAFTVNVNQTQLDNVVNYTLISDMVWAATNRTLSEFNFSVTVNETAIADAVWLSSNRTLSYYPPWADLTNYTLIQEVVWTNAVRTLTDFNFTVETNNTNIAEAVWQYTNKTVQFANGSVDTVGDIRDMGHTYVGGTEYVAGDAGKITIRLVRGTGALAEVEIGAQCSVNVLYPNMTDFVNNGTMTEIGDGAYYYNFLVPTQLGIYTYFTNCNISDRFYFSLDDFHVYAPDYSSIPGQVWSNPSRNLTYTAPGLTANDVWTAPTRDLTYYPTTNISLTNQSIQELGNAVWAYNGTISPNILTQFSNSIVCAIQNIQTDLNLKWGVQLNSC